MLLLELTVYAYMSAATSFDCDAKMFMTFNIGYDYSLFMIRFECTDIFNLRDSRIV